ncbi:MAG: ribosome small subunit-dependent GTPase A [Clostridia bacterium]|nr:ribosome small subunit-dependent GTPase A [Clostridia bacterium]
MNIEEYGLKDNMTKNIDKDAIIARIIATHKDRYEIICNKGQGFAQIKRGKYYDNPNSIYPTTGDFVLIEWNYTGDSMIYETLQRESSFSRTASSSDRNRELHSQHEQLVAANFDYVFIIQSLNNNFNVNRIERYLSMAWESGGIPVIVLTKSDLVQNVEEYINEVKDIAFGVDVYAVSNITRKGIEEIKKYFSKGNTIVFLGSSGVGKSSLVNTLYGEEVMKTSEIREIDSRGRHTTTSRNLIMLPNGAMIIDTPGMRELGMWDAEEGISKTFKDIEEYIGMCKYSDCTHTNEPGCKVQEAIENGELSKERFEQYLKLQKESRYNTDSDTYLKEKKNKFKEISKINRNNRKK